MSVKIIYYVEVISSWCLWAEPAWAGLKKRYSQQAEFDWRIGLLGADGMPASVAQEDWFYRRSSTVAGSPYSLNSGWMEPGLKEYLAPNCVALAAREFGIKDDRVRLALADAAMREGRKIGRWEEAAAVAAIAGGLDEKKLLQRAKSPEIEKQARGTTAEFHSLQVNQRPTFVLESNIGDKAVFSGFWRLDPLVAAVESMLADAAAYASWKARFGDPPPA